MNLLLLFESDRVSGDDFVVRGARAAHLIDAREVEPGTRLQVGLLDGPRGAAAVQIDDRALHLAVDFESTADPRPQTDLILAIPRPKVLRRLLPQIAAIGVDRLFLVRSWKVERSYLTARVLEPADHRPRLHEGLMQACATAEPVVSVHLAFKPFIEDVAPTAFADARRLLADPRASTRIRPGIESDRRVVIAIGPEGGWQPYERDAFAHAGFDSVSLGPRVLKVETACIAALGQIDIIRDLV